MPRVEVSPGFLVVLGALFWLDEGVGLLPWGLLACFFHELGHVVAATVCGGHVRSLSLTVVGAELRMDYDVPLRYGQDSLVALAGPGANLLFGLLALGLTLLMVRLLNKKINPVWLIFALFGLGIIGNALGFLS